MTVISTTVSNAICPSILKLFWDSLSSDSVFSNSPSPGPLGPGPVSSAVEKSLRCSYSVPCQICSAPCPDRLLDSSFLLSSEQQSVHSLFLCC
jgi:hypothetical protein